MYTWSLQLARITVRICIFHYVQFYIYANGSLKGQCHEICGFHFVQFWMCKRKFEGTVPWDFGLQVFSCISFSKAPEYPIRAIFKIFFLFAKYSQLKVHCRCRWHRWQIYHRCHWYQWQIATVVIDTGSKFGTSGRFDTGGKFYISVIDTSGVPWLANISEQNFWKNLKRP